MENEMQTTKQLFPLADIERMGKIFTASGFFGYSKPEEAMALMLQAQADGIHPAKAAQQYHIIHGRPALKSEAMLARFQVSGGKIAWKKHTSEICVLWLSHPQGGEIEITWSLARAKASGLLENPNWKKYPDQMLSARCVSEGVRAIYPACLNGCYTPEEISDIYTETHTKDQNANGESVSDAKIVDQSEPKVQRPVTAKKPLAPVVPAALTDAEKRDAFIGQMKKFEQSNRESYLAKMGEIGFEKAEDVPADQMHAVMVAVKNAVTKPKSLEF